MKIGADLVLGIDAGTGGIRACLFDLSGRKVASAERSYTTSYPNPGLATQRPEDWWTALVDAVRDVAGTDPTRAAAVTGIAIDAPCNIMLTDLGGSPLHDALMWMDLRGSTQAERLTATDDPVLKYCGFVVPAEWPLPKALWLKEREPALWERAGRLVEQMTWLTWRLTGQWVAPLNSAAAKWHYRIGTGWPRALMNAVDLGAAVERLPSRIEPMGGVAGQLTPAAASTLGLQAGVPVAMSGIDAHAGMLGVGVAAPGALALITGTSTCHLAQTREPIFDDGLWGPFEGAVVDREWTVEAGQASTGGTVRWIMDVAGARWPQPTRYESADAEAAAIAPGSEGLILLDFWQGSRTPIRDPNARGTIVGLTAGHGAAHLLRAVYEGTSYGNRRILERLAERGVPIDRIVACGGGIRSRLWLQILADVAGIPIAYETSDDAVALGSAMCAAVAAGAFADIRSAAAAMSHPGGRVEPDPRLREIYDVGFAAYEQTFAALRPIFARQAHRYADHAEPEHSSI